MNIIIVIVDDIVDSAGTLCDSAELLKANGVTKIYAFITHGIFSGDAIEKIFVTDSRKFNTKGSEKIKVVPMPDVTNKFWFNK